MMCILKNKGKAKLLNNNLATEASFEMERLWENGQLLFKRVAKKRVSSRQSSRKMVENIRIFLDQRTGVLQGTGDLRRECQPENKMPIKGLC